MVPTLNIPSELAVWDILLGLYNREHSEMVEVGVRRLARDAGVSVGAARRCTDDLERRELITPLEPGPYGRSRWRMAIASMPSKALDKPETERGRHHTDQARNAHGQFGPKRDDIAVAA